MANDLNLQFIRDKVYQLRSAIMYSMSNELVKIPNNVVTALRIDEEGNLWFLSKRPAQFVSECEQSFPARLHFYRKGISFFVEVSGKATIVNDETISTTQSVNDKPVLIKMTMRNIEYVEPNERKKNKFELTLDNAYKWILKTITLPRHSKPFLAKLKLH
jgi:general stress protein 26